MEAIKFNKKEKGSNFNKALNEAIKKSVDVKNKALKTNKIVIK